MEAIICCLFGVFVGMAVAGYMCVKECARKEQIIAEQKEENLQVCSENKDLRAELEDTKEDKQCLQRQIENIKTLIEQNSYGRDDIKLAKLKEVITSANVK